MRTALMRCWTASRGCTGAPWATSTGSLETRNVSLQQAVGEEHQPIAGHDRQRLHPILELAQPEPDPRSRAATAALRHRWRGSAWPATRRHNGEEWVRAQGRWGAGALAGRSACCQQTTRVPGRRRSPGVVGLPKLIGRSGSTDSWIATGCPVLTAVRPEIGAQPRDLERPSDRVARPKAPR